MKAWEKVLVWCLLTAIAGLAVTPFLTEEAKAQPRTLAEMKREVALMPGLWAVSSKTETYDIECSDTSNGKFGELTITVRKYTNQGTTNETFYEVDDDMDLDITNNDYKTKPAPIGDESIAFIGGHDMAFEKTDTFESPQVGEPDYDVNDDFENDFFLVRFKSTNSLDFDDWWTDPDDADFDAEVIYFNDTSNYAAGGGYAEIFTGTIQ